MRAKKYLIVTLAVLLALSLGLVACKKDKTPEPEPEPEPAPAPTITLNQTSALLDMYESVTLTATTANTASAVVWSTSDASVASVDGGVVTAVAVGFATITASVDDVSATCSVTVTNSYTAPVLNVNEDYVSVALNGSFTVTAETTWKGAPLTGVTYSWQISDGEDTDKASVTPSSDTASAVVQGLAYGETAITVSADVRGVTLVKTIGIKVCNVDITFDVTNLTPVKGGYQADVSLVATDTDPATVTPEVYVYDKGEPMDAGDIVWTLDGSKYASFTDGVIDALAEGRATVTGSYNNNTVKIFVNAYRPFIALPLNGADEAAIETAAPQYALAETLTGTVTGARLDGTDVFGSYDAEENAVTFDTAKLPSEVDAMGPGKQLIIDTDMAQYTADAGVYTKVLRTPDDVNAWNGLAYDADSSNIHWGGYFVLGNDIDMSGQAFNSEFSYLDLHYGNVPDNPSLSWTVKPEYKGLIYRNGRDGGGFRGIFDGRGYNIDNLNMAEHNSSFAGQMAAGGTVRNVSFTNVTLGAAASLISCGGIGRIENVYAEIVSVTAGNAGNDDKTGIFFGQDSMADARIVNCFADVTTDLPVSGGFTGLGSYHLGYGQLNGMYAVGLETGRGFNLRSTGTGTGDAYGAYATYNELLSAGIDFSSWAGDFWQIVNGVPYPAGLDLPEGTTPTATVDATVPSGGSVTVNGLGKYDVVTISDAAAALGVTFTDGRIVVPESVKGGVSIAFTVSNVFDDSLSQSLSVTTIVSSSVELEEHYTVEIEAGDTFSLDFGAAAESIIGSPNRVEMDGTYFEGAMTWKDGILTLETANLVGSWGDKTLTITFLGTDEGGQHYTFVTAEVTVITMVIDDETELNRFLEVAAENATGSSWGGYFVLGDDIVCTGTYASHYVSGDTRGDMGTAVGFNGIFDGQGYTIYNLHTVGNQGGFVGPLGQHGILRNVSFVNATNTGNGGFITSGGAGTVENVFVHISVTPNSNTWGSASSVLAGDPYGTMRFNNVIVEYSEPLPEDATTGYPFWNIHLGYGIVNGVYAVGVDKVWQQVGDNLGDTDVYGAYDTWADFAAEGTDFSAWTGEGSFWTLVDGIPMPARLAESEDAPEIGNTQLTVTPGTVAIDVEQPFVTLSLDAAATEAGVTLGYKSVIVPDSAVGLTFTVTATSLINGLSDSVTFTVPENVTVDVAETTEIDMTASGDLTFDLTDYAADIEGEFANATIGGTAFTTLQYAGNTLTLDRATLGSLYGEQTIEATFEVSDGNTVTKITTVNIPVLLVTKYISVTNDLANLASYLVDEGGNAYGGYFVQTADIDMAGARAGAGTWVSDAVGWGVIFRGIYDGAGHVISNTVQGTNQGLFSNINGGTVKNLVFYNAQLNGEGGIVTTQLLNGTVENVAVYGSMTGVTGASWSPNSLLVGKAGGGAIRNCLVVLTGHNLTTSGTNAGMILGDDQSNGALTVENSLAVNLKNAATSTEYAMPAIGDNDGGGRLATGTDRDTVHTFHGWAEYIAWAAKADLSAYTGGEAWAMNDSKIPVASAASIFDELAAVDVSGIAATVPAGEATTLALNDIGYYADFAVSAAEGVSLTDGVVTVDDTFSGSFTLTVKALLNDSLTKEVEIASAATATLTERTEVEMNYDAGITNTVDLSAVLADGTYTVDSLTVAGKSVNATVSGTTLTITDATRDIGNTVWGEQTMVLTVRDADGALTVVNIPVLVITQVIRTPEQLANWNTLAYAADSEGNYWAGYFVLGDDINMAGTTYNSAFSYLDMFYGEVPENPDLSWTVKPEYAPLSFRNGHTGGFRGVFDGRGHVIDNLNMAEWNGSFAGQIATAGVVRNIVFTNVTLGGDGATSLVSVGGTGRIENVYAHIVSVTAGNPGDSTGVFFGQDSMADARVVNCFALFDPTPSTSVGADTGFTGLGKYHKGFGILNNVYAVGLATGDGFVTGENIGGGDIYGAYATAEEFAAAVTVDAENGWDMTFWTTDSDGLPIPVTLAAAQA